MGEVDEIQDAGWEWQSPARSLPDTQPGLLASSPHGPLHLQLFSALERDNTGLPCVWGQPAAAGSKHRPCQAAVIGPGKGPPR